MVYEITIDRAGRLVVPKPIRDRLGIVAGTRLRISEDDGRIVVSREGPEPHLVERDGFLIIDLGGATPLADHRDLRETRTARLVDYAMRR